MHARTLGYSLTHMHLHDYNHARTLAYSLTHMIMIRYTLTHASELLRTNTYQYTYTYICMHTHIVTHIHSYAPRRTLRRDTHTHTISTHVIVII